MRGWATRCCMSDYAQAQTWHEKQLDMALTTKDKVRTRRIDAEREWETFLYQSLVFQFSVTLTLVSPMQVAEGRACSNLGIVYQLMGHHDAAVKLHQAHLNIARLLQDRAYENIGNAYSAMGYYEQAIKYHKQELTTSKEVLDWWPDVYPKCSISSDPMSLRMQC